MEDIFYLFSGHYSNGSLVKILAESMRTQVWSQKTTQTLSGHDGLIAIPTSEGDECFAQAN